MSRNLASIQKILDIKPIEGADKIELARVLGWQVVIIKDQFKVGDLCVYCEADSLFPDKPEFEFLRPRKFRVKTIRLRGTISQGIVFSLSILGGKSFPSDIRKDKIYDFKEGMIVTEMLGIELYQPPIPPDLKGLVKGAFPGFIPKTDETRVQLLQSIITRYKGTKCYFSEKVDGSSCTVFMRDGILGVCSRNLELLETPDNAFWKIVREDKIEEKLRKSKIKNIAIQGELVGHGIQKNPLKIEGRKIFWFNVFDIDSFKYLDFEDFISFCKELKLETVPILNTDFILIDNIDELVKLATDKSIINKKSWREGIVIRPLKEIIDLQMSTGMANARVSFKCINPEYLLENE